MKQVKVLLFTSRLAVQIAIGKTAAVGTSRGQRGRRTTTAATFRSNREKTAQQLTAAAIGLTLYMNFLH